MTDSTAAADAAVPETETIRVERRAASPGSRSTVPRRSTRSTRS